jgi:hypothetical protein
MGIEPAGGSSTRGSTYRHTFNLARAHEVEFIEDHPSPDDGYRPGEP